MALTFQIIGYKKSGKTLITTELVRLLTDRHLHVSVLKHDAHASTMDTPGTDTAQFSHAGAQEVILQSANGTFCHQTTVQPVPVSRLIARLPTSTDVILLEGFKHAPYPKIALLRSDDHAIDFQQFTNIQVFASLTCHPDATLVGKTAICNWFVQTYFKGAATTND
ncbi:molybdopterin-guanine dinucleotide biosynthesis protein B [Lactiplantibacillus plantarum]|uniref:molybdopterin-guanine dinucleotide biosynthesis protein B n=1 Tax=Lactiplantibacillus plantarum TaxID=1590 RepID=UPI000398C2B9|nr:molybdopterin-guanine dinucleotide biosynthesis protein B [Lactiplantibacillus plantarum]ERJ52004.1 molybdopterin-guanine dinucleotide biosynthesis protein MobB [Lactiplantibacillus plantarum 2165]TYA18802.1 molybdopterin-guanine dinucleotide biosynthesis protein B [Lactobacillus sp. LSI2-1]MBA2819164.1 Molybdopterin-guanine dinucleotide biosynthesis adapter protein [Lactiplantibacillus plantarum]MBH5331560.1 molybdopterin-guanine dinucleotide biosynthesis protein B [Lactiplantibacillus plan